MVNLLRIIVNTICRRVKYIILLQQKIGRSNKFNELKQDLKKVVVVTLHVVVVVETCKI